MHMFRILVLAVTVCGANAEVCCPLKDGTPNDVSNEDEYPNLTCDCGPGYDSDYPESSEDGQPPPHQVTCIKHPSCTAQAGSWNDPSTYAPATTCICPSPLHKLMKRVQTSAGTSYQSTCIPLCETGKEFTFANADDCLCTEGPRTKDCTFKDPSKPADDDKCVCKDNPDYVDRGPYTRKACTKVVKLTLNSMGHVGPNEIFIVGFIISLLVTDA